MESKRRFPRTRSATRRAYLQTTRSGRACGGSRGRPPLRGGQEAQGGAAAQRQDRSGQDEPRLHRGSLYSAVGASLGHVLFVSLLPLPCFGGSRDEGWMFMGRRCVSTARGGG